MLHFRQNEVDSSILVGIYTLLNATQNLGIDKSFMSCIKEKKKKKMVYM